MKFKQTDGFSVVELAITLAVAAVAVILITSLYSTASRLVDRNDDLLAANQAAYVKLQEVENKSFDDIIPSPTPTDFSSELPQSLPIPREAKLYISSQNASLSLKYIFVRVKYGPADNQHVVEYGDFVQKGGLGR